MAVINAIKEETTVGQAMQTYARLQAEIKYHNNQVAVLKKNAEYLQAKKTIEAACKCNEGKMVVGSMKATLVEVQEHVVQTYEYVRISGLPKSTTPPTISGILAGITPEQWAEIQGLFNYEAVEA